MQRMVHHMTQLDPRERLTAHEYLSLYRGTIQLISMVHMIWGRLIPKKSLQQIKVMVQSLHSHDALSVTGDIFPEYFYSFLHDYFKSFCITAQLTPDQCIQKYVICGTYLITCDDPLPRFCLVMLRT